MVKDETLKLLEQTAQNAKRLHDNMDVRNEPCHIRTISAALSNSLLLIGWVKQHRTEFKRLDGVIGKWRTLANARADEVAQARNELGEQHRLVMHFRGALADIRLRCQSMPSAFADEIVQVARAALMRDAEYAISTSELRRLLQEAHSWIDDQHRHANTVEGCEVCEMRARIRAELGVEPEMEAVEITGRQDKAIARREALTRSLEGVKAAQRDVSLILGTIYTDGTISSQQMQVAKNELGGIRHLGGLPMLYQIGELLRQIGELPNSTEVELVYRCPVCNIQVGCTPLHVCSRHPDAGARIGIKWTPEAKKCPPEETEFVQYCKTCGKETGKGLLIFRACPDHPGAEGEVREPWEGKREQFVYRCEVCKTELRRDGVGNLQACPKHLTAGWAIGFKKDGSKPGKETFGKPIYRCEVCKKELKGGWGSGEGILQGCRKHPGANATVGFRRGAVAER